MHNRIAEKVRSAVQENVLLIILFIGLPLLLYLLNIFYIFIFGIQDKSAQQNMMTAVTTVCSVIIALMIAQSEFKDGQRKEAESRNSIAEHEELKNKKKKRPFFNLSFDNDQLNIDVSSDGQTVIEYVNIYIGSQLTHYWQFENIGHVITNSEKYKVVFNKEALVLFEQNDNPVVDVIITCMTVENEYITYVYAKGINGTHFYSNYDNFYHVVEYGALLTQPDINKIQLMYKTARFMKR